MAVFSVLIERTHHYDDAAIDAAIDGLDTRRLMLSLLVREENLLHNFQCADWQDLQRTAVS